MRDIDLADPHLLMVEQLPFVKLAQWPNEERAVVFNERSGDTFEVDAVAASLIVALGPAPMVLKDLLAECKGQASSDDIQDYVQFFREYLLPLQALDLVRVWKP